MEFHPDPAGEEEEMRPLHLVLRNMPGKGGSGGGEEDRGGETVWKFVSPSCRARFLFSWRSKLGEEGLVARPAVQPTPAPSREWGGFLCISRSADPPRPHLSARRGGSGPPGVRGGHGWPLAAQPPAAAAWEGTTTRGHLATTGALPGPVLCQGRQGACGTRHFG